MEFIPETRMVLNELIRNGETEVAATLLGLASSVEAIVPDIVGLSFGQTRSGVVFTLAASGVEAAGIDSTQYVDGGPCVDASTGGTSEAWVLPSNPDELMDEQKWASYARASAAEGIASSLSLPLVVAGRTVGGVNMYASTPDAFEGHHEALANMLGAEVTQAVANADLAFGTRKEAEWTAKHLADEDLVHLAVGIIAERHQLDIASARTRLKEAAERAGITHVEAAKTLIKTMEQ